MSGIYWTSLAKLSGSVHACGCKRFTLAKKCIPLKVQNKKNQSTEFKIVNIQYLSILTFVFPGLGAVKPV